MNICDWIIKFNYINSVKKSNGWMDGCVKSWFKDCLQQIKSVPLTCLKVISNFWFTFNFQLFNLLSEFQEKQVYKKKSTIQKADNSLQTQISLFEQHRDSFSFLSYYPLSLPLYGGGLTVFTYYSLFLSWPYYIHRSYFAEG